MADKKYTAIDKHIKDNSIMPIYLLCGDEDYLKKNYKDKLIKAISGDDTMNFSYFEGNSVDVNEIADLSVSMPFFAEKRLIVVENSKLFKNASDTMPDIVKNAPDTTIFIFVESEVDKRNRLYKAVNENGFVAEFSTMDMQDMKVWAAKGFARYGKKITGNDMEYFLSRTGLDMNNVYNEIMKLVSYTGSADVITREDIDAIGIVPIEDKVFEMIDAIGMKKIDRVMKLYGDLMALKEAPVKLLVMISRQFATLLSIKDISQMGLSNKEIASRVGMNPYFAGKNIAQAANFSYEELKEAVNDCIEAETQIKSGKIEDKYALELLIVKFSRK